MSFETTALWLTTLMMLFAAAGGAAGSMQRVTWESHKAPVTGPQQELPRSSGEILLVEVNERKIVADVGNERKLYRVAPGAIVYRDERKSSLTSLARGDHAVFQLASSGSDVVTRIHAFPRL